MNRVRPLDPRRQRVQEQIQAQVTARKGPASTDPPAPAASPSASSGPPTPSQALDRIRQLGEMFQQALTDSSQMREGLRSDHDRAQKERQQIEAQLVTLSALAGEIRNLSQSIAQRTPETFRSAEVSLGRETKRLARTVSAQRWLLGIAALLLALTTYYGWKTDRALQAVNQNQHMLNRNQKILYDACKP